MRGWFHYSFVRLREIRSTLLLLSTFGDFSCFVYFCLGLAKIQSEKGSKQECKYNLMCLGFTPTSMPKELDDEEDDDMGGSNNKKRKVRTVKVTEP